jgi:hypothetical protein
MFDRGRIDHLALSAADTEAFERRRADRLARGCTYGTVTDLGVMRILTFTDPDSRTVELAHWVGGADPTSRAMSRATDDERTDNGRSLRLLFSSFHTRLPNDGPLALTPESTEAVSRPCASALR